MNIEVLIDKKENNLSIICTEDGTGVEIEQTLSLEEAWAAVSALNLAIQQLLPSVIAKGAVVKSEPVEPAPERVQAAVLEAIGADQIRPRHMPPGSPADDSKKKKGLRNLYEPIVEPEVKGKRKRASSAS